MKKNGLMRISAALATALMMVSVASMAISANVMKNVEALRGGRTVKTTSRTIRTSRKSKGGVSQNYSESSDSDIVIAVESKGKAKPGEIVEIPLVMYTNDRCTCFDLALEYDPRFEFVSVEGAKAVCDFEDSGRKFVSIVCYEDEPFKDGEAAAVVKLRVPDDAENDDYNIRFSQITTFSDEYEDFEDYEVKNTYIKVTGGIEKVNETSLKLSNVTSMAGCSAVVQVVPKTNNKCKSYNMLIEYDPRLYIEDKDIAGANTYYIFEENGKNYVSLVGYTNDVFADGQAMAALNFTVPEDATRNDTYDVKIADIKNFSSEFSDFNDYITGDSVISILESDRPSDKYNEYMVYVKYGPDGKVIFSMAGSRGDANCDGKTDVRDAATVARACANRITGMDIIDEMGKFFGDVDENGKLDIRDAAKIARYIVNGKISWDNVIK